MKLPTVTVWPMYLVTLGIAPISAAVQGNKVTITQANRVKVVVKKSDLPADFLDHPEKLVTLGA